MGNLKFADIQDSVKVELEKKLLTAPIPGEGGFSLINGFLNPSVQSEISSGINMGGPSMPMVGLVGNASGRVYAFALKAILPDIEI